MIAASNSIPNGHQKTELGIAPEDWKIRSVGEMGDVRAGKALAANAPGERRYWWCQEDQKPFYIGEIQGLELELARHQRSLDQQDNER